MLVQAHLLGWMTTVGLRQHYAENEHRYIFQFTGDKGACLPRAPIYVAYWGLTVPWSAMDAPPSWVPPQTAHHGQRSCCATTHEVIVPPFLAWTPRPNSTPGPLSSRRGQYRRRRTGGGANSSRARLRTSSLSTLRHAAAGVERFTATERASASTVGCQLNTGDQSRFASHLGRWGDRLQKSIAPAACR